MSSVVAESAYLLEVLRVCTRPLYKFTLTSTLTLAVLPRFLDRHKFTRRRLLPSLKNVDVRAEYLEVTKTQAAFDLCSLSSTGNLTSFHTLSRHWQSAIPRLFLKQISSFPVNSYFRQITRQNPLINWIKTSSKSPGTIYLLKR